MSDWKTTCCCTSGEKMPWAANETAATTRTPANPKLPAANRRWCRERHDRDRADQQREGERDHRRGDQRELEERLGRLRGLGADDIGECRVGQHQRREHDGHDDGRGALGDAGRGSGEHDERDRRCRGAPLRSGRRTSDRRSNERPLPLVSRVSGVSPSIPRPRKRATAAMSAEPRVIMCTASAHRCATSSVPASDRARRRPP